VKTPTDFLRAVGNNPDIYQNIGISAGPKIVPTPGPSVQGDHMRTDQRLGRRRFPGKKQQLRPHVKEVWAVESGISTMYQLAEPLAGRSRRSAVRAAQQIGGHNCMRRRA